MVFVSQLLEGSMGYRFRELSWVRQTPWCLAGNGGIGYGDYYWGLYRDYYRVPFPHSLLRVES